MKKVHSLSEKSQSCQAISSQTGPPPYLFTMTLVIILMNATSLTRNEWNQLLVVCPYLDTSFVWAFTTLAAELHCQNTQTVREHSRSACGCVIPSPEKSSRGWRRRQTQVSSGKQLTSLVPSVYSVYCVCCNICLFLVCVMHSETLIVCTGERSAFVHFRPCFQSYKCRFFPKLKLFMF